MSLRSRRSQPHGRGDGGPIDGPACCNGRPEYLDRGRKRRDTRGGAGGGSGGKRRRADSSAHALAGARIRCTDEGQRTERRHSDEHNSTAPLSRPPPPIVFELGLDSRACEMLRESGHPAFVREFDARQRELAALQPGQFVALLPDPTAPDYRQFWIARVLALRRASGHLRVSWWAVRDADDWSDDAVYIRENRASDDVPSGAALGVVRSFTTVRASSGGCGVWSLGAEDAAYFFQLVGALYPPRVLRCMHDDNAGEDQDDAIRPGDAVHAFAAKAGPAAVEKSSSHGADGWVHEHRQPLERLPSPCRDEDGFDQLAVRIGDNVHALDRWLADTQALLAGDIKTARAEIERMRHQRAADPEDDGSQNRFVCMAQATRECSSGSLLHPEDLVLDITPTPPGLSPHRSSQRPHASESGAHPRRSPRVSRTSYRDKGKEKADAVAYVPRRLGRSQRARRKRSSKERTLKSKSRGKKRSAPLGGRKNAGAEHQKKHKRMRVSDHMDVEAAESAAEEEDVPPPPRPAAKQADMVSKITAAVTAALVPAKKNHKRGKDKRGPYVGNWCLTIFQYARRYWEMMQLEDFREDMLAAGIRYISAQLERAYDTGRLHIQMYVETKRRQRRTWFRRFFGNAHCEPCYAEAKEDAIHYTMKPVPHCHCDICDAERLAPTAVKDTWFEFGTPSLERPGKRNDWDPRFSHVPSSPHTERQGIWSGAIPRTRCSPQGALDPIHDDKEKLGPREKEKGQEENAEGDEQAAATPTSADDSAAVECGIVPVYTSGNQGGERTDLDAAAFRNGEGTKTASNNDNDDQHNDGGQRKSKASGADDCTGDAKSPAAPPAPPVTKRKRGRPRKYPEGYVTTSDTKSSTAPLATERKRGWPRKYPKTANDRDEDNRSTKQSDGTADRGHARGEARDVDRPAVAAAAARDAHGENKDRDDDAGDGGDGVNGRLTAAEGRTPAGAPPCRPENPSARLERSCPSRDESVRRIFTSFFIRHGLDTRKGGWTHVWPFCAGERGELCAVVALPMFFRALVGLYPSVYVMYELSQKAIRESLRGLDMVQAGTVGRSDRAAWSATLPARSTSSSDPGAWLCIPATAMASLISEEESRPRSLLCEADESFVPECTGDDDRAHDRTIPAATRKLGWTKEVCSEMLGDGLVRALYMALRPGDACPAARTWARDADFRCHIASGWRLDPDTPVRTREQLACRADEGRL